jgi:uncharacterized protein (TIGR02145 family)
MEKFSAILAILALVGILFSCHPDAAEGNPFVSGGLSSSSSSFRLSSSSINSINYSYGSLTYGGQTYKTVKIGEQVWMAENLNYNASGSICYNNQESNCVTHGRLYNWETAMSVCPLGWHLPTNIEWEKLFHYVDGTSDTSSPYDSPTAGKYLKAKSGWYNNGNGKDSYGFSALPSNYYGEYGFWWTASEYDSNDAYMRFMNYEFEEAYWLEFDKSFLFSVRCVQGYLTSSSSNIIIISSSSLNLSSSSNYSSSSSFDYSSSSLSSSFMSSSGLSSSSSSNFSSSSEEEFSSSSEQSSSSKQKFLCGNEEYEPEAEFCDSRDKKIYKKVTIGSQTWMAENLNYNASESRCYGDRTGGDSQGNCVKYGRLYSWAYDGYNWSMTVCPSGWHLPTLSEWYTLSDYVGGSSVAGKHLKAKDSCALCEDTYGFSALSGGSGSPYGNAFYNIGTSCCWWTASGVGGGSITNYASNLCLSDSSIDSNQEGRAYLYSVRCIKDE